LVLEKNETRRCRERATRELLERRSCGIPAPECPKNLRDVFLDPYCADHRKLYNRVYDEFVHANRTPRTTADRLQDVRDALFGREYLGKWFFSTDRVQDYGHRQALLYLAGRARELEQLLEAERNQNSSDATKSELIERARSEPVMRKPSPSQEAAARADALRAATEEEKEIERLLSEIALRVAPPPEDEQGVSSASGGRPKQPRRPRWKRKEPEAFSTTDFLAKMRLEMIQLAFGMTTCSLPAFAVLLTTEQRTVTLRKLFIPYLEFADAAFAEGHASCRKCARLDDGEKEKALDDILSARHKRLLLLEQICDIFYGAAEGKVLREGGFWRALAYVTLPPFQMRYGQLMYLLGAISVAFKMHEDPVEHGAPDMPPTILGIVQEWAQRSTNGPGWKDEVSSLAEQLVDVRTKFPEFYTTLFGRFDDVNEWLRPDLKGISALDFAERRFGAAWDVSQRDGALGAWACILALVSVRGAHGADILRKDGGIVLLPQLSEFAAPKAPFDQGRRVLLIDLPFIKMYSPE
jgi:hypothetical protein